MEFDFNGKKVGENNKVFIIAELSANHNQNYDIAVKTIKAMKELGQMLLNFRHILQIL